MSSYTKLFSSILNSSIWSEDNETRIVWITLLALADKNGEVEASIPGIARQASVSIEHVKCALDKLEGPDVYSRTPDHEGRRIQRIQGGWIVLNHAKYREKASSIDRREKAALRQMRKRDASRPVTPCHAPSRSSAQTSRQNCQAEADTDRVQCTSNAHPESEQAAASPLRSPDQSADFGEFWQLYPRKVGRKRAESAWRGLTKADKQAILLDIPQRAQGAQWTGDGGRFIPHPATYLNGRRWEDAPEMPRAAPQTARQDVSGAGKGQDSVWQIKTRLEACEKEIAKVRGRGWEDAFGWHPASKEDFHELKRLRAMENELRKKLTV